jgi:hypothetical protein
VNTIMNLWVPYNMEDFLTSKKMLVSREGVNCCQLQKLPLAEGVATYSEIGGVSVSVYSVGYAVFLWVQ